MNPLPADFDLSQYVGEQLGQICVGQYQVQLKFDSFSIEGGGKLDTEIDGTLIQAFKETWKTTAGLERFIGGTIRSWQRRSDNCFSIDFEEQISLIFHTENGQYEDFTIWFEKDNWLVL